MVQIRYIFTELTEFTEFTKFIEFIDTKRIFTDIYRFFLSYRPTSIYRLEIDKGETPFTDWTVR